MELFVSIFFIIWLILFINRPKGNSLIYALFLFPPAIIVLSWPVEFYIKRWIALALLLFLFRRRGWQLLKVFPLKWLLVIMFLESCILILPDSRFDLLHRMLYPLMDALDVYLPLFFGFAFVLLSSKFRFEQLLKPITICCIIVEIYGIYNLLTGTNPVEDFIYGLSSTEAFRYTGLEERAIVRSIFRYSFDFGFNSTLLALLLLYYYLTNKINFTIINWIALGLSSLGVFLSGSRSVIIAAAAAILVFIVFMRPGRTRFMLIASGIAILVGLYYLVPAVSNIVDMTLGTITGSEDYTGSSTEMRLNQLAGAMNYMEKNPLFGNGFKYVFIDLDWKNHSMVDDMAGYESLVFSLMIERGIFGLVAYCFFLFGLISYFGYYSIRQVPEAILGLSVMVLFLIFAVFTGALDAWLNTMVICGILIARISERKFIAVR